MKVEHTHDSPILLKLIPENTMDVLENGRRSESFTNMGIRHVVKDDGVLLLNIDPAGWKDFTEHSEEA